MPLTPVDFSSVIIDSLNFENAVAKTKQSS